MKIKLENWQHALLSAGILIVVLFILYSVLVAPALASRARFNERYADLQLQLSKFKQVEQQLGQLKSQLAQLNDSHSQKAYFLEEKPDALAAADLQKYLKSLVESHEGQLVSTQPIEDRESDIFPKVTIKIHMRVNINALQETLYNLESSTPKLFIDNIIIQNRNQRRSRSRQTDVDQLDVRFDVTGYVFDSNV